MSKTRRRITPVNLTARLQYQVKGNPSLTLPDDVVANCYPGLEVDVRNLERRFFPGLVFEFIARNDVGSDYSEPTRYGARLSYVDLDQDPDLQADDTPEREHYYRECKTTGETARNLRDQLARAEALSEGDWYLDWVEQDGKRLQMNRVTERPPTDATPLDGLFVWRLLRSLDLGPLTIGLKQRSKPAGDPQDAAEPTPASEVVLNGWRRRFLDPVTGVINGAYQPGEMLQSLCSPWQHDFRDCYCHYWASNHPDIVFAEVLRGDQPGTAPATDLPPNVPLDWLRADRAPGMASGAFETHEKNRPHQIDHYQINAEWQNLDIVIDNAEITGPFIPQRTEYADPFAGPEELAKTLSERLAPLELALALEYLYARFSLLTPAEAQKTRLTTLERDVTFARHQLLLVATSEMQHLRWVNELLWHLHDLKLVRGEYQPVFNLAADIVPGAKNKTRDPLMRRLEPDVLEDYIFIEHPSTSVTGQYARVIATLRDEKRYPGMLDLALRIANEGAQHERSFMDMKRVLSDYTTEVYLRKMVDAPVGAGDVQKVLKTLKAIVTHLKTAYKFRDDFSGVGREIVDAREAMNQLLDLGEKMALKGRGIPFIKLWRLV